MQPVRVLHVAETLPGGIATIMNSLIKYQAKRYGAQHVLALIPQQHSHHLSPTLALQKKTYHRTGRNLLSFICLAYKLACVVWVHNPQIVHLHSTFAGVIGRLVLLLLKPWRNPKVIYCPHAFVFLMEIPVFQQKVFALVERLLTLLTDRIICISRYEKRIALKHGFKQSKLIVILNGVEPPQKIRKSPFRKMPGQLNLLFVGRFDHQKGFDFLRQVMKELQGKPVHLTAVGAAVNDKQTQKSENNITYAGWLKPQLVASYFTAGRDAEMGRVGGAIFGDVVWLTPVGAVVV